MDQKRKDDDDLEKLLHSMPKRRDTRSKEEVLKRLENDERLSPTPVTSLRKKKRIVPLIVAAAVLLVAMLIPSFMNSLDLGEQIADEASMQEKSKGMPEAASEEAEMEGLSKDASTEFAAEKRGVVRDAIYPADLDGGRILHLGLQDVQSVSIPVSVLLTKEQIEAEGLTDSSTDLELYEAFAGLLDAQALGFKPMQPIDADFTEEGDRLNVLLNDAHEYALSTSEQEVFLHSLMQTFPSYLEIHILDSTGNPAEFDQVGQLEPIRRQGAQSHTPYYVYRQENGQELLSPNFMQQADSFEEALRLMQIAPNDLFDPVIPKELEFTVVVKDGIADVEFNDTVQLDSMEMNEASRLIDALTLTAASFDVQLKLSNVEPLDWNGMNFREALPNVLGPNPVSFIQK
ncbi:hypothetical protein [Sporosarcina gallistercoris]|uniref:GerMN domain-containing protein n=1 Tax=Sporosarcina gallistercoris TaxID=2762245 RepID=A0ABR8PFP9_9BACL|nr:hypothetical protein [Sporosarcina gallistercoris]MBD7906982.1 hypothetical protein [Sporosarcina gallistercoris]